MPFNVGDTVTIKNGRAHHWQVVRIADPQPHEREPGYVLSDGNRTRTAAESALILIPAETTADRDAYWERHHD